MIISAFFNLLGAFVSTEVAKTIGKGIILPEIISQELLIFSLIGAIVWVVFSTHFGIPISVTHSLLGGLIGAGLVRTGISGIKTGGIIKVIKGIIGAPIISFFASAITFILVV